MSLNPETIPIIEGLFVLNDESPQLIGSACMACGEIVFPKQKSCPACSGQDIEVRLLSRRGQLWTWTVQSFTPPPPFIGNRQNFQPYGVGYVELPEGIRVEGRLSENDPSKLQIGMTMELILEPFCIDAQGRQVTTFAFRPINE